MGRYLFSVNAFINAKFEKKSIESIIQECGKVNAVYYNWDTQIYHELSDIKFQNELLNQLQFNDSRIELTLRVDNLPLGIGITKREDGFYIRLSGYTMDTYKHFNDTYAEDTIPTVRLLLKLISSFVIKKIRLLSEYQLFPQGVGTNIISAYALSGRRSQDFIAMIISMAFINHYIFIEDSYSENQLKYNETYELISAGAKEGLESQLLIKVKDAISILRFGRAMSIIPQEPYRIKTVGDRSGIDVAFYTEILLNLAEPFGMHELEANFES